MGYDFNIPYYYINYRNNGSMVTISDSIWINKVLYYQYGMKLKFELKP